MRNYNTASHWRVMVRVSKMTILPLKTRYSASGQVSFYV